MDIHMDMDISRIILLQFGEEQFGEEMSDTIWVQTEFELWMTYFLDFQLSIYICSFIHHFDSQKLNSDRRDRNIIMKKKKKKENEKKENQTWELYRIKN